MWELNAEIRNRSPDRNEPTSVIPSAKFEPDNFKNVALSNKNLMMRTERRKSVEEENIPQFETNNRHRSGP